MTIDTLLNLEEISAAGMSQIIFLARPQRARCVVGSCIAITLYHRRTGLGALAHIVLPDSRGATVAPGKFADTAVPHMTERLLQDGANTAGLVATISGGASMFGARGPMQIGEGNTKAVTEQLQRLGIPIVGKHVAGAKGRCITFDCETGEVIVAIMGQPPRIL